jgi:hypothetical protein
LTGNSHLYSQHVGKTSALLIKYNIGDKHHE